MSPRPVLDAVLLPIVRPSARVGTVARLLDDDPSQIRRMIRRGQLEAHREGKRGVRVYLDSVEAWQKANSICPVSAPVAPAAPAEPSRASRAAHGQAMTHLRALGVV
jgi:excisionase family DNA binding protein